MLLAHLPLFDGPDALILGVCWLMMTPIVAILGAGIGIMMVASSKKEKVKNKAVQASVIRETDALNERSIPAEINYQDPVF